MNILVIDDNPIHCEAAKRQLSEHDVTVVSSYDEGQALLGFKKWGERSNQHDFDVVLCDLLMPASSQMQGSSSRLAGMEMPVGIFLGLLAAKNGAKYVAVFTDANHHQHPASACFDAFNKHEDEPSIFKVEGAKMLLSNYSNWVGTDESVPPRVEERVRGDRSKYALEIYQDIKRWDLVLQYLVNPPPPLNKESIIA